MRRRTQKSTKAQARAQSEAIAEAVASTKAALAERPPICCICNKPIDAVGDWRHGNNAMPVKSGRCCSVCNADVVIPCRIFRLVKTEGRWGK